MNDTQQLNRWLQALQAKSEVQLAHVEAEIKRAALQASTELIQELQLHQIELEMQNEELRRMQVALRNLACEVSGTIRIRTGRLSRAECRRGHC